MKITEKKNRRIMLIGIMLVALLIPSVALATTYNTTLFFQAKRIGEVRSYAAGNMRCIVNDATTPVGTGTVTFTVTCKESVFGVDPQIGTTKTYSATPSGYDNSRYFGSGVDSGDYYFIFTEDPAKDIPIASDEVTLKTE